MNRNVVMRRYQGRRKSPLGCGIKIRQSEQNKWYDRICPICFVTSKGLFAGGILTTEWVVNFSLDAASVADMSAVQNMMQLYTHDFSEFWAGTPRGELGQDGRFPDYPIAPYFECPRWSAFLFKIDDKPVGFALINDKGHSALPTEYSVGEFFIVRKYRGQGLGLIAAQRLFHRYPGAWEVAVARKNTTALVFWQGAIRKCAAEGSVSELDWNRPEWNGAIFRFRICA